MFVVRPAAGCRFRGCRMRHGFPAATTFSGTSFVTTEHAPDDRARPDFDPGHDKRPRADKGVFANRDFRNYQWHGGPRKVVASCVQVRFLRDHGARSDFDLAEAVCVRAVAETGTVVQCQIPRDRNARPLVDERRPLNFGVKYAQPKKAPWIRRFRSPAAKNEPAEFPKHASQAFAHRPGGDELRALCGIDAL